MNELRTYIISSLPVLGLMQTPKVTVFKAKDAIDEIEDTTQNLLSRLFQVFLDLRHIGL